MVSSYTQPHREAVPGKLDSDADEFIEYAVDGATWMQTLIQPTLAYPVSAQSARELNRLRWGAVLNYCPGQYRECGQGKSGGDHTTGCRPYEATHHSWHSCFKISSAMPLSSSGESPPRIHISARREEKWRFSVA